ncbi:MAG: ATP-dependent DNA helicase [Caldilineaceae bacterium]
MSKLSPASDAELVYEPIEEEGGILFPKPKSSDSRKEAEKHKDDLAELRNCNLADFFGSSGPLAKLLAGYELRPSQLEMAEATKRAILEGRHALIEAPTGTGKSIAYLVPAILSGKTVIVATANKSLQSQLFQKDIPFLRNVMKREISAVLVKGRSNFVCNYKWENEAFTQQQFALYDKANEQIQPIKLWLDETETGDVDDLPFMIDSDLRPRIVSFPDDCLHDECIYWDDDCWVNLMRDKAANAQILVTNHHLLLNALELGVAGERILPPAAIYVIDEAHGLEQTATSVYETLVSDYTVEQLLARTIFKQHVDEDEIEELRFHNTLAFQELSHLSRDNAFRVDSDLEEMKKLSSALSNLAKRLKEKSPYGENGEKDEPLPLKNEKGAAKNKKSDEPLAQSDSGGVERKLYELAIEQLSSIATKLLAISTSKHDKDFVRYASRVFERRHITIEVHAAPINPAALLAQNLFHPESVGDDPVQRTVICTSATLAANREFAHFKMRCGIDGECEERVLPAVFDYPKQALLYQPPLPAFDYKNSDAFYAAAGTEIRRLLEVSRGRSLCLFTSWSGLQQVYDLLRSRGNELIWPLRAQGDAPRDALLTWFKSTPYSVLLATRSFWEGVDIPGEELSLVVLDKMPFPTPGDPLHSARMKAIDDAGRSSFGEYMVPLMTLALKQGFGRLIRRATDNGVVAILDERLSSKNYGRQTRNDLPPARFSREFKDVHRFFQVSLHSNAEFALNVWGGVEKSSAKNSKLGDKIEVELSGKSGNLRWRWQLLRLNDGKADEKEGEAVDLPDATAAELYAALEGLNDLQQRIERAGRAPKQFAVEIRCTPAMKAAAESGRPYIELARRFAAACALWQQVGFTVVQVA